MAGVLFVVSILAFISLLVWAAIRAAQRRIAQIRQVAEAMGFAFHESIPDTGLAQWTGALPLFHQGHSRRADCVLIGEIAGQPVVLMDYTYVIGSGKGSASHPQTVAIFTQGGRGLPDFDLSPENLFHKIGQVFGYQDIDVESNEEFSRRYLLRGPDESAVRAAFGPEVVAFLAAQPGWSIQAREGRLAVFRADHRAKPPTFPAFLADALRIAGTFSPRGVS